MSETFHHIYVYIISVLMVQHLQSRSRSGMKNSLLKLKSKRSVIMLMSREKHF